MYVGRVKLSEYPNSLQIQSLGEKISIAFAYEKDTGQLNHAISPKNDSAFDESTKIRMTQTNAVCV